MAIQADITNSQFGVPFNAAYFRIASAGVSRQRSEEFRHGVVIDVVGYATQPSNEDTREVDFRRYHAPYIEVEAQAGDNFLAKCYAWVMAQADMAGSTVV
jgi:hypothetical protein